ncbi:PREDICTED: fructose-2,6-bisphosphatase TIGAR [Gekko japonicus]|uniref:Fructose-2,6-bisphosphatase TIGAR n=1 Tax=Gekko japonicus TaxID=146911 RepID=A0ABM1JYY3_GEKJA|nr:PREDICTED: fructose-2,6-bisphosphatase TIGAR [Gekko japonicus]
MFKFGLTVVRHGETRYNKEKILQGQGIDEPLSQTGFQQANAAGVFLSNVRFTHVFSSDLLRAKQTAASILRKSQFSKEIAVKYDSRLRERKYGVAEGRPLSDLRTMAKAAGEQCPSFTPPGGETLEEVKARSEDFFADLCSLIVREAYQEKGTERRAGNYTEGAGGSSSTFLTNHHGSTEFHSSSMGATEELVANILVVSHGAYMRNWLSYFVLDLKCILPASLTKAELSSVSPNTGISKFIVKLENRDNIKPKIQCICLNRDDHLGDMAAENI